MQPTTDIVDIDDLIDTSPIGRLQLLVALIGTLVIFVDGFNIQVMGYIAPQLAKAWNIPHDLLGPIFSSGLLGVFFGYLFIAPLSNRVGHRTMIIVCTAIFSLLTLMTTLASGAYMLMGLRFITGLALGASNPSAVSVIADFCPKHRRSTFVVVGISGVSLGSMCAGLAARLMMTHYGWQGVLVVGGLVPLAVTVLVVAALPNSLDFLALRKHDDRAALALARRIAPHRAFAEGTRFVALQKVSGAVTQVFVDGRLPGTICVWIGFTANLLVYFFVQSWLSIMIVQAGHSQEVAVTATTVLAAGGALSIFAFGPLMDRFQPFVVIGIFFLVGGAMVALLGSLLAASVPAVMASAFLVGFVVLGVQKGMNAIAVFFYPTALRSTGLGWGLGIGRLGAVIGPVLAGVLMSQGFATSTLFYWGGIPMALGAAAMFFMFAHYGDVRMGHGQRDAAARSVTGMT